LEKILWYIIVVALHAINGQTLTLVFLYEADNKEIAAAYCALQMEQSLDIHVTKRAKKDIVTR